MPFLSIDEFRKKMRESLGITEEQTRADIQKQAQDWYLKHQAEEQTTKQLANTVADLLPFIGDVKAVAEAGAGKTALGEPLEWWERGLSGLGALPIVPSLLGIVKGAKSTGIAKVFRSLAEPETFAALDNYLRDSGFVNVSLRGRTGFAGLSPAQRKVVDTIDELVAGGKVTEKETTVYRALPRGWLPQRVGEVYRDKGFLSTTTNIMTTRSPEYVHPKDRVVAVIKVPSGVPYMDTADVVRAVAKDKRAISLAESEFEYVFGRNHLLEVERWNEKGDKVWLRLKPSLP